MSKSKKSKKKKNVNPVVNSKRKANTKKAIIATIAVLLIAVAVCALLLSIKNNKSDISNTEWVSSSAVNASGRNGRGLQHKLHYI